jgi:molybdopterin synthase sulfur carrier subunit
MFSPNRRGSLVSATLFLPAILAKLADNMELAVTGSTGGEVAAGVAGVAEHFLTLAPRFRDADGKPYQYVTIYLNDEGIRFHGGFDAPGRDGDKLSVVPAIAGG